MPIYEQPTKVLMGDWARDHLALGQIFEKSGPTRWFEQKYPKIKWNTVGMHVEGMSVNNRLRRHHPSIKPGSGHDLFFKLGPNKYRLWDPQTDPPPLYKDDIEKLTPGELADIEDAVELKEEVSSETEREFAFERDLRNYLVRNLTLIEPGLRLYTEEGLTGVEYPVGS